LERPSLRARKTAAVGRSAGRHEEETLPLGSDGHESGVRPTFDHALAKAKRLRLAEIMRSCKFRAVDQVPPGIANDVSVRCVFGQRIESVSCFRPLALGRGHDPCFGLFAARNESPSLFRFLRRVNLFHPLLRTCFLQLRERWRSLSVRALAAARNQMRAEKMAGIDINSSRGRWFAVPYERVADFTLSVLSTVRLGFSV